MGGSRHSRSMMKTAASSGPERLPSLTSRAIKERARSGGNPMKNGEIKRRKGALQKDFFDTPCLIAVNNQAADLTLNLGLTMHVLNQNKIRKCFGRDPIGVGDASERRAELLRRPALLVSPED